MVKTLKLWLVTAILVATGSVAAQSSNDPIKVGGTTALTGEFAGFGKEHERGLRFWKRDINGRGSLLGRPVEVVIYDDESKTSGVAELYEKLIVQDRVNVLVSPWSTPQTLEAAAVAERHGIPMVTVAAAPVVWQQGFTNTFGVFTPADHNMDPVFAMAEKHGFGSVAIAYQRTEFPEAVAAGARAMASRKGIRVVYDEGYPADATDLSDVVRAVAASNADVVIVGSYLEDSVAFMRAAKAQNFNPGMIAFSGAPVVAEFGEALGTGANGALSTAQWMRSAHLPGSFDFGFRFQGRYGVYPSYHAAGAYASGQILEAAVRLAQSVESAKVREQLGSMIFRSILGHYRVDETGIQTGKSTYLIQWQDGHRSLVYPPDIARWDIRVPFPTWSGR